MSESRGLMKKIKIIDLYKNLNLLFLKNNNIFVIKGYFGMLFIKMSNLYFMKKNKNISLTFLFLSKILYTNFIKTFLYCYNYTNWLYCIKLKIKGLGFKIKKFTKQLYYFFFNSTNMYYMHIPSDVLIKVKKKRIILLSFNFLKLKTMFANILLLKKIGPYRLRGIRYPRQIILLKKRNKKI